MELKRQREVALVLLVVALIAVFIWRVKPPSSNPAGFTGANTSAARTSPLTRENAGLAEIDLQALEIERPEPQDNDRNPFRFKPKVLPPPPPMPETRPTDPVSTGLVGPPPPPPIPLKFIGLATSHDDPKVGRVAILRDGRGVYYGREGEIIEGRYRILKIGVESIDLAYLDGRGRQTIRQTGQ